jgi:hypothetical protein
LSDILIEGVAPLDADEFIDFYSNFNTASGGSGALNLKQNNIISVANQADMLALTGKIVGDIVIREDDNNYLYRLTALPASNLSNWEVLGKDAPPVGETVEDVITTNEVITSKVNGLYAFTGTPNGGFPAGVTQGDIAQKTASVWTVVYTFINAPAVIFANSDGKTYFKTINGANVNTWQAKSEPSVYEVGPDKQYTTLQSAVDAYQADFTANKLSVGVIFIYQTIINENVIIGGTTDIQNLMIEGYGVQGSSNVQITKLTLGAFSHRIKLKNLMCSNTTSTPPLVIQSANTCTENGVANTPRGKHFLDNVTVSTPNAISLDVQSCENFLNLNKSDFGGVSKIVNIANKSGIPTSVVIDGCSNGLLNIGNNRIITKNNSASVYRGTISTIGTIILDVDTATPIAYSILRSYTSLGAPVPITLGSMIINDDVGGTLQMLKCITAYTVAGALGVGTPIDLTKYQVQTDNLKENAFTKNTAFNKNYSTTPTDIKANGMQSLGTLDTLPRADHTHPTDTTREAVANKVSAFTGTPNNTNYITEKLAKDSLDLKLNASLKGSVNGVAELGSDGRVPSSQLPSFVDDVLEFANFSSFPATGETAKIYIAIDTNITYRWSGTIYVEISSSLALGETSATAYRGDRGKIAYDHSQIATGNPHNTTKTDIALGNVDNTSDLDKPISTATQDVLDLKQNIARRTKVFANQTANFTISQADIDNFEAFEFNQTTASIVITLSAPTASAKKDIYFKNIGTASINLIDTGTPIATGKMSIASYNGASWNIVSGGGVTGILPIANGGTGADTLAKATIATQGYTTTETDAGTTTLTVASTQLQYFTGTLAETVVLPVVSTLTLGQRFEIHNNSTGVITVNSSGGNLVQDVPANGTMVFTCVLITGTSASSWDFLNLSFGSLATSPVSFWAYSSTEQTLTNAGTKINLNNVLNDLSNSFNTTTNRFNPTVAGYYHFDWIVSTYGDINSGGSVIGTRLYKNGTVVARGVQVVGLSAFYWNLTGSASSIYLNGTTDYVELYHYAANTVVTGITVPSGSTAIALSGFLQNPPAQFAQAVITAATDPTYTNASNQAVSADWVRGAALSTWVTTTTNITATTTNPTKGTIDKDVMRYRKVGDKIYQVQISYRQTAGGTSGSGIYLYTLPAGLQFDLNAQRANTNGNSTVIQTGLAWSAKITGGTASIYVVGSVGNMVPYAYDATRFYLTTIGGAGGAGFGAIQHGGYFQIGGEIWVDVDFTFTATN